MKIKKANRSAVRSTNRVNGIAELSTAELRQVTGAAQEVCWWISWWFEGGQRVEEFNYHVGYPQDA